MLPETFVSQGLLIIVGLIIVFVNIYAKSIFVIKTEITFHSLEIRKNLSGMTSGEMEKAFDGQETNVGGNERGKAPFVSAVKSFDFGR